MSSSSSTIPGIIVAAVIAGIMVFAYLNKDNSSAPAAEHAGHSAEHAGHAAHSSDEHAGYSGSVEGYLEKFSK